MSFVGSDQKSGEDSRCHRQADRRRTGRHWCIRGSSRIEHAGDSCGKRGQLDAEERKKWEDEPEVAAEAASPATDVASLPRLTATDVALPT